MTNRVAIIVGSGGQDGQLLHSHLLALGYSVIGLTRENFDILSANFVSKLVSESQPAEVYYLAAYHHSSEDAIIDNAALFHKSFNVHVHGLVNFLDAIAKYSTRSRLFYASSSLIFGNPQDEIQTELSKLNPENPYAISKVAGMMACRFYREHKGVFASCGILYNHESSLRSPRFVTQKIIQAAVKIFKEGGGSLTLGDLDVYVDWGYAPDYVNAMTLILSLSEPNDFIVATGEAHSIREFAELSFKHVGLDYRDFVKSNSNVLTRSNSRRVGNPFFIKTKTGWRPSVSLDNMVALMMEDELKKYSTM